MANQSDLPSNDIELKEQQLQQVFDVEALREAGPKELKEIPPAPELRPNMLIKFQGETHSFPASFTDDMISQALSGREVQPMKNKVLHGNAAIKQVEKLEGTLTEAQKNLVKLEGYSTGDYSDTKGIKTRGVGQTGAFADMTFKEVYQIHVDRTQSRVPDYTNFPGYLQQELVQAEYRGDLGGSPTFRRKLNSGEYRAAAAEFLDNDDYRESLVDKSGVAPRMKQVHDALIRFATEQEAMEQQAGKPSKGGLFEDENGVLFMVDEQGNKREV